MEKFRLGHLLSITHGRLLCEGENHPMDGVYRILNYLTGDSLFTHQLPSAAKQCAPHIIGQYPSIGEILLPEVIHEGNWKSVMAELKRAYGDEFELSPLPTDQKIYRNPLDDLPACADIVVVRE